MKFSIDYNILNKIYYILDDNDVNNDVNNDINNDINNDVNNDINNAGDNNIMFINDMSIV